jgi:AraC family transcriptional regulator of adaptative response/methylated-DNA-[protein]-cysteine methyltransferase
VLNTPTDLKPAATKDIGGALNAILADAFALSLKTKNFHWHISGPHFREAPPSLKLLAQHVGLSTYHFHSVFKAATGLTPKVYAAAHRASLVRKSLNKSDTVTDAIYDAGYNSNSRFYETSNQVLGMTPSNYRAGGAQTDIRFAVGECSLGSILVAQSERGICAIFLGDDPDALVRELQDQFPNANLIGGDTGFEQL